MYYIKKQWTTAKKQEYNGFHYDSGFEARYAMELDLRLKAKEIESYERQVNLEMIVNGYKVWTYRIDFIIHHLDGLTEYIECKGYPTPVWKLKWLLFEALYADLPDTKLTIVQQGSYKPPKLHKKKNI